MSSKITNIFPIPLFLAKFIFPTGKKYFPNWKKKFRYLGSLPKSYPKKIRKTLA